MASSIDRLLSGRAGQQLAGDDPARAGRRYPAARPPRRSMPAKRPRTSSSPSFTSTSRPSGPALASHVRADRREAVAPPFAPAGAPAPPSAPPAPPRPCRRGRRRDSASPAGSGAKPTLTPMPSTTCSAWPSAPIELSGRMPATLPPSTSTSLGHFTRTVAAGRHHVGHGERRHEAQLGRARRRAVRAQDRSSCRDCRPARPRTGRGGRGRRSARAPRRRCLRARRPRRGARPRRWCCRRCRSATSVHPSGRTGVDVTGTGPWRRLRRSG